MMCKWCDREQTRPGRHRRHWRCTRRPWCKCPCNTVTARGDGQLTVTPAGYAPGGMIR